MPFFWPYEEYPHISILSLSFCVIRFDSIRSGICFFFLLLEFRAFLKFILILFDCFEKMFSCFVYADAFADFNWLLV